MGQKKYRYGEPKVGSNLKFMKEKDQNLQAESVEDLSLQVLILFHEL